MSSFITRLESISLSPMSPKRCRPALKRIACDIAKAFFLKFFTEIRSLEDGYNSPLYLVVGARKFSTLYEIIRNSPCPLTLSELKNRNPKQKIPHTICNRDTRAMPPVKIYKFSYIVILYGCLRRCALLHHFLPLADIPSLLIETHPDVVDLTLGGTELLGIAASLYLVDGILCRA